MNIDQGIKTNQTSSDFSVTQKGNQANSSSAKHEKTTRILSVGIRVLVLILFVGWIFLWVMMPTNTYRKKWLPKIRQQSYYSTYFGSEGLI